MNLLGERITSDCTDYREWKLHRGRYEWAARYTRPEDRVVDAACGIGYGKEILNGSWIGIDRYPLCGNMIANLEHWSPVFEYDVFVGIETLEHLKDPTAYIKAAKQAKRAVVLSTPIVPTVESNPWHLTDWTKGEVEALFSDWKLVNSSIQVGTYGLWAWER